MSVPTGSPGAASNGLSKIGEAIKILQDALGSLPIGSDPHKAVISAISGLGRHVSPSENIPGNSNVTLQNMLRNSQKNSAVQQVQRSLGGPQAAAGGPPPQPGAA